MGPQSATIIMRKSKGGGAECHRIECDRLTSTVEAVLYRHHVECGCNKIGAQQLHCVERRQYGDSLDIAAASRTHLRTAEASLTFAMQI